MCRPQMQPASAASASPRLPGGAGAAYLARHGQPSRCARRSCPVTPLQQNCTLIWCTATMRGAFVDPGGDLPSCKAAAAQHGVTIEKIILTHGHIDHCGAAKPLAERARRADRGAARGRPLLDRAARRRRPQLRHPRRGVRARSLAGRGRYGDGRRPDARRLSLPRATRRAMSSSTTRRRSSRSSATCCSRARSAGPTFPLGNHQQLLDSIVDKLWPLGDDTAFVPGHGPTSTFGQERQHQPVRQRPRAGGVRPAAVASRQPMLGPTGAVRRRACAIAAGDRIERRGRAAAAR